ncbi:MULTISPECIES: DMT family transporter [unclassified Pannonibacter]|uniref:DMT family transporter n=1 Tax=unclassified Pannonibacter TaxID=2627228 RepID=UPI001AD93E8C|nr:MULTISPECIES: DMT family transporter [unclassified Pannonibacter]
MAVFGAEIEPVGLSHLRDEIEGLRSEGRLAFKAMQHNSFNQIAKADPLLGCDGLQNLKHALLDPDPGLNAFNFFRSHRIPILCSLTMNWYHGTKFLSRQDTSKGPNAMTRTAANGRGRAPVPHNVQGILWALLAAGLYAAVAALAKLTVTEFHVLQILFIRQAVVFLLSLPALIKAFPQSLQTRHPGWHGVRLAGAFIALSSGIWAVAVLPLTTAITLSFSQVFFVTLLAMWVLGEPVGRHRIGAVMAGFLGVVVVMRPGIEGFTSFHALIPLFGGAGAAVAVIAVRRLSQTESTATLLVYQAGFIGLLSAVPLPWVWVPPDLHGLILLLTMGGLATAGQWAGVKALRLGEVSVIGNLQYTQLVYAVVLGFVLFGEVLDTATTAGAAIIVGAASYLMRREAQRKRGA